MFYSDMHSNKSGSTQNFDKESDGYSDPKQKGKKISILTIGVWLNNG